MTIAVPATWPEYELAELADQVRVKTLHNDDTPFCFTRSDISPLLESSHKVIIHTQKTKDLQLALHLASVAGERIIVIAQRSVAFSVSPEESRLLTSPRLARIIAVSRVVQSRLIHDVPRGLPPVDVVYPSVDISRFASPNRTPYVDDGTPVVGIIANHYGLKRIDVAVRSARLLLEDRKARLLSVGTVRTRDAEQLACELGISPWCRFVGWQRDVQPWLAQMDIVMLCSDEDAAPVALLEAMAMAKPIVATQVGGVPELVRDGVEALLVPPNNSEALAASIRVLLDNQRLALQLARAAQQRCKTMFRDDLRIDAMVDIYKQLNTGEPWQSDQSSRV